MDTNVNSLYALLVSCLWYNHHERLGMGQKELHTLIVLCFGHSVNDDFNAMLQGFN